jgi:hypothetical protein
LQCKSDPKKIRASLAEIKGLGNVGIDIFFDTTQHPWTCLAPFLDPRSAKTADAIGIDSEVKKLWDAVGKGTEKMCRVAVALTEVRLQKVEKGFS